MSLLAHVTVAATGTGSDTPALVNGYCLDLFDLPVLFLSLSLSVCVLFVHLVCLSLACQLLFRPVIDPVRTQGGAHYPDRGHLCDEEYFPRLIHLRRKYPAP